MDDPDGSLEESGYRTVQESGESYFEIKGSKFRGRVTSVSDIESAETFIANMRQKFPDATHVVSAYRVREQSGGAAESQLLRTQADDDGEPSGSAGSPALTLLERRELENVAAAVVRHYGGTNLGIGGLSRAYSRAVGDAVEDAGVQVQRPHREVRLTVGYDDSGTIRSTLESATVSFEATYGAEVSFLVQVPVTDAEALVDRIRSATHDRVDVQM
jgi:uncharacterized YigZ family protein